jgi:hypothetical protein
MSILTVTRRAQEEMRAFLEKGQPHWVRQPQ